MRTVIYYVPEEIGLYASVEVHGGHWTYGGDREEYGTYEYISIWLKGETGVMTLAARDLDHLVSKGLVILGDVCEP